jgi:hypothetical protein
LLFKVPVKGKRIGDIMLAHDGKANTVNEAQLTAVDHDKTLDGLVM